MYTATPFLYNDSTLVGAPVSRVDDKKEGWNGNA
jgi:hypothetical protein